MEERYWILLNRHAANDLTTAERKELQYWAAEDPERNALLNDFREIRNAGDFAEAPQVNTDVAWAKMEENIINKPSLVVEKLDLKQLIARAAIIAAIISTAIISFVVFNKQQAITVATKQMEQKDVILPDGSQVHLTQNSSITYKSSFKSEDQRKVKLAGEAFFEVTKDPEHPFVVETGFTQTTALGTSFNLTEQKNGTVNLEVVTGSVAFHEKGNDINGLTLSPGDAGTLAKNSKAVLSKVTNTNFMFFKNQQLDFINTPLIEVLQTLEQNYKVNFSVKDSTLAQERLTISFNKQNITEIKQALQAQLNVKISVSGSNYLIGSSPESKVLSH